MVLKGMILILGEAADDILDGGKGDDEIRGGDGSDQPLGDEAYYRNEVYGGSGDDNIDAGIDYTRYRFLLCVWRSWL